MTRQERAERVENLYRRHGPSSLGFLLRRTRSAEDAADILSEVFTVVWRRSRTLPAPGEEKLWMYGIARHVLMNHHRSDRRASAAQERLVQHLSHARSSGAETNQAALMDLQRELAALAEVDRDIVTLTAWEGLTSVEIGKLLGLAPGTVRSRLHRARHHLHELSLSPIAPVEHRCVFSDCAS